MSEQPQAPAPDVEDDFPDDFEGFMENPDAPESNLTDVVDGVSDVPQDPNWKPEGLA